MMSNGFYAASIRAALVDNLLRQLGTERAGTATHRPATGWNRCHFPLRVIRDGAPFIATAGHHPGLTLPDVIPEHSKMLVHELLITLLGFQPTYRNLIDQQNSKLRKRLNCLSLDWRQYRLKNSMNSTRCMGSRLRSRQISFDRPDRFGKGGSRPQSI